MGTTINNNVNKKITYIDSVKGFSIWLVVLGHLLNVGNSLKSIIYGFHMPVFFSVYGLTYRAPQNAKDLINRLIKRFFSYYVTYLLWAMIYAAFSIKGALLIFYGTNQSVQAAGSSGVLWFLPAYFSAVAIFEVVMFITRNAKKMEIISGAIFFIIAIAGYFASLICPVSYGYPLGLDIGCVCAFYIWFGYILKNYVLTKLDNKKLISIVCIIIGFAATLLALLSNSDKGYIRYASADYGNPIIAIVVAICGIVAVITMIYQLDKVKIISKILSVIGTYSLVIMVLQRDLTNLVVRKLSISDNALLCIAMSIALLIIAFIGSFIISKLIPVLAGKHDTKFLIKAKRN